MGVFQLADFPDPHNQALAKLYAKVLALGLLGLEKPA